ncbi:MAG: hypothetical protein K9H64_22200 [Bacteroidales bacterium]|nr:hypothetical protein [Bacteroidales bacterium]MCF8458762.1 hypothetical protein [Bacteroidales bacterium]
MKISIIINKIGKYEAYFFYALVLINLLPVLLCRFFPTVDGPAHLYNANLIVEMLKNPGSRLDQFFVFNSNLNPNWTGHLILSGLLFVFPAWLSEKILVVSFLLFFPLSFRYFFHSIGLKKNYLLFLIFPFTYSYLLLYGFFNFQLALIFLFLSLGLWSRYKREGFSTGGIASLLVAVTLICLSHLFVFAVFLLILAVLNLGNLTDLFNQKKQAPALREIGQQILFVLPGLVVAILYFVTNPVSESHYSFPSFESNLQNIWRVQPMKAMRAGKESIYASWVLYSMILLTLTAFFYKLKSSNRPFSLGSSPWGILVLLFLFSLFIMPHQMNEAIGFISSRLVFFFFVFVIVWLATQKAPSWMKVTVFIIINYVNFALIRVYVQATKESNRLVTEIVEASKFIEPYSTVLAIPNSGDLLHAHTSNYLGVDKPMIILENYEALLDHFPLKWNYPELPNLQFGEMQPSENCLQWQVSDQNRPEPIDYVLRYSGSHYRFSLDCIDRADQQLNRFYDQVFCSKDGWVKLYRIKKEFASSD